MRLEQTILRNLICNDEYARRVLPYLKDEYFSDADKSVFKEIQDFVLKYNERPTYESLTVTFNMKAGTADDTEGAIDLLKSLKVSDETVLNDWLMDQTEKFCQDKALYNAIYESIQVLDGKSKQLAKGAIPDLLEQALAITFNDHIGHDYFEDAEEQFRSYHEKAKKIAFSLGALNKATKGGVSAKTLNCFLAGTNVGKSLVLCDLATSALKQGHKVLYITLEMSEEQITKRIDANLLNLDIDEIENVPKDVYLKKVAGARDKTDGKLIVHEYPTAQASVVHFRSLLNELKLKKKFVPDVIFVDYINLCCSSRYKSAENTYGYVKAIAEELRGLAVQFNVPIWTATQTTRSGISNSDPELEDTSESIGLPATLDLYIAIVCNEELEKLGQYMFKQLKNRYNDKTKLKRFMVGVDRNHMRLFDVEQTANAGMVDTGQKPVDARPVVGPRIPDRNKFAGIKV
jgi:replicative DNA helicase